MLDQTIKISKLFPKVDYSAWENLTKKGLDTENIEDKLVFKSIEGVDIFPLHYKRDWHCELETFPENCKILENVKIEKDEINLVEVHNAGASIIQELTYALHLYNQALIEKQSNIKVHIATDSLFFSNIAKLRALRFMFERMNEESGHKLNFIFITHNSLREQTLFDPWVNMLRSTTSAMAGILGGADFITSFSYDHLYTVFSKDTESNLGKRNALNELKILLEESKLDQVNDPLKGSYSLEDITYKFIEKSWSLFVRDENNFLNQLETFSKEVEKTAIKRFELVRKRKITITGINNFANPEESLESIYPKKFSVVEDDKGLFPLRFVSSEFDILRASFKVEENKIALLKFEKDAKISARVNFCKNYFEVIGAKVSEISEDEDFSQFKHIIICSTDSDYDNRLEEIVMKIKKSKPKSIYLAGKRSNIEDLKITDSLYMGQDIYSVLNTFVKEIC